MRTTPSRLGMEWGKMPYKVSGQTKYEISPFEQRPYGGAIVQGIPNTLWRIRSSFFSIAIPFAIGYMVYNYGEKEHARMQRKQPGQFDDEE